MNAIPFNKKDSNLHRGTALSYYTEVQVPGTQEILQPKCKFAKQRAFGDKRIYPVGPFRQTYLFLLTQGQR
jgi:hypothetical protein